MTMLSITVWHVQKAYTSLATSCHNAYIKSVCWLNMHILSVSLNIITEEECILVYAFWTCKPVVFVDYYQKKRPNNLQIKTHLSYKGIHVNHLDYIRLVWECIIQTRLVPYSTPYWSKRSVYKQVTKQMPFPGNPWLINNGVTILIICHKNSCPYLNFLITKSFAHVAIFISRLFSNLNKVGPYRGTC